MKVFITGIDGILGSTLKEKLRAKGHDVWGCDLTHSHDPQIVRGDVSEIGQLGEALKHAEYAAGKKSIDLLYHFAAEFGRNNGRDFPEQLWKSNCLGTNNVIRMCVLRHLRMVFASSSEAYGLSEQYAGGAYLEEGMLDKYPPQFHNIYALSKYTNERQITMAVRNQGLRAIILRFFNIYGPPERYSPYRSVVCQFIYKMLAGLPLTVNRGGYRTHLWIGDWANTVSNIANDVRLRSLDKDYGNLSCPGSAFTPGVPVFNIGGVEYESIQDLYKRLAVLIPDSRSRVTFIDNEEANTAMKRPANGLATVKLDHNPSTPLTEGLRKTVDWMKETYGF